MDSTLCALHTLRMFNNYFFDVETETLFDACNYSMFKYGSGTVARLYGEALAKRFIKCFSAWLSGAENDGDGTCEQAQTYKQSLQRKKSPHLSLDADYHKQLSEEYKKNAYTYTNKLYVTSSPYKVAPTAAHAVAVCFTEALNKYLEGKKLPRATLFKIERLVLYEEDYGKMSAEQRRDVMGKNLLQLPQDVDLKNATIILIDDIRVTGAHEKAVLDVLKSCNPRRLCKLYVALFENDKGLSNPQLEGDLNHFVVKNLDDLNTLIKSMGKNFIPNARVCKFLLSQKDTSKLERFLVKQSICLLETLLRYMTGDGFSEMPAFKHQFDIIRRSLERQRESSQSLIGLGLSMMGGAGGIGAKYKLFVPFSSESIATKLLIANKS